MDFRSWWTTNVRLQVEWLLSALYLSMQLPALPLDLHLYFHIFLSWLHEVVHSNLVSTFSHLLSG